MTLKELKDECLRVKAQGGSGVYLTLTRKTPPSSEVLRVKGMGKGLLCNAVKNPDGTYRVTGHWSADTILRTIAKQESEEESKNG